MQGNGCPKHLRSKVPTVTAYAVFFAVSQMFNALQFQAQWVVTVTTAIIIYYIIIMTILEKSQGKTKLQFWALRGVLQKHSTFYLKYQTDALDFHNDIFTEDPPLRENRKCLLWHTKKELKAGEHIWTTGILVHRRSLYNLSQLCHSWPVMIYLSIWLNGGGSFHQILWIALVC